VLFRYRQKPKRRYWLVLKRPEIDLCLFDPGFGTDLEVLADIRALAEICLGQLSVRDATIHGALALSGPRYLCKDFSSWLGTTHFAAAAAS
jgi:hypothetical protein